MGRLFSGRGPTSIPGFEVCAETERPFLGSLLFAEVFPIFLLVCRRPSRECEPAVLGGGGLDPPARAGRAGGGGLDPPARSGRARGGVFACPGAPPPPSKPRAVRLATPCQGQVTWASKPATLINNHRTPKPPSFLTRLRNHIPFDARLGFAVGLVFSDKRAVARGVV